MATTPRKENFVWVSWLTGLLSGTQQCQWAAWFRVHFKYEKLKTDFNLESWSADHDALMAMVAGELEADGWQVKRENENWMRMKGQTAVLVGKPDVIADRGGQFKIVDGKTGDSSRKDLWQMWLYLYMLPKVWKRPTLRVTGEVVYKTNRIDVFLEEFTAQRQAEAFQTIRLLASDQVPKRSPSVPECSRCDIADCPERAVEQPLEQLTAEF